MRKVLTFLAGSLFDHDPISSFQLVKRVRAETVLTANLRCRHASFLLFDHSDDLRFGETAFPHVVCSFRLDRLYITPRELSGACQYLSKVPVGGICPDPRQRNVMEVQQEHSIAILVLAKGCTVAVSRIDIVISHAIWATKHEDVGWSITP